MTFKFSKPKIVVFEFETSSRHTPPTRVSKMRQSNLKTTLLRKQLEDALNTYSDKKDPELTDIIIIISLLWKCLNHHFKDITVCIEDVAEKINTISKKRRRKPQIHEDVQVSKKKRGGSPENLPDEGHTPTATLKTTPKKRGRPPKKTPVDTPKEMSSTRKKRGRPPKKIAGEEMRLSTTYDKQSSEDQEPNTAPKKRGRPPKIKAH